MMRGSETGLKIILDELGKVREMKMVSECVVSGVIAR